MLQAKGICYIHEPHAQSIHYGFFRNKRVHGFSYKKPEDLWHAPLPSPTHSQNILLIWPQRKKYVHERSGCLGGQTIGPPQSIHCPGTVENYLFTSDTCVPAIYSMKNFAYKAEFYHPINFCPLFQVHLVYSRNKSMFSLFIYFFILGKLGFYTHPTPLQNKFTKKTYTSF